MSTKITSRKQEIIGKKVSPMEDKRKYGRKIDARFRTLTNQYLLYLMLLG